MKSPKCFNSAILFIVLFLACNEKKAVPTGNSVKWDPQVDSLLRDSAKINPVVDSLKHMTLNAENDSLAINSLNDLAQNWRGSPILLLANEAFKKSEEINYAYGKTDAICRMGCFYLKTGQNKKADSLFNLSLQQARVLNSKKLEAQALSWIGVLGVFKSDYQSAIKYDSLALDLAQEINDKYRIAFCLGNLGQVNSMKGDYVEAMKCYDQAVNVAKKLNDKTRLIFCYGSMGEVCRFQSDYASALEYYNKAADISRAMNNKTQLASNLSEISAVYRMQGDYSNALEYFKQAISIGKEINDKSRISFCLAGMGEVYRFQKKYPEALKYYHEALTIAREIDYLPRVALCLGTIGEVYSATGDYSKALDYFKKSLEIAVMINDKSDEANCLRSIGEVYFKQNYNSEALDYSLKALKTSVESHMPLNIKESANLLSRIYDTLDQPAKALPMYRLYVSMKDSISNEAQVRKFAGVEFKAKEDRLKAESEAKEKVFKALDEKKDSEIQNQKQMRNLFIIGFILLGILVFFIFRSLQQNKKARTIIEQQKEIVEMHRKEIIDSITYAKRLQQAILPSVELIADFLPESFIFYKPKDIVAGDFYWMEYLDDTIFIAAADSTGHGVPGAMVSVVCSNALNRAVKEFGLRETGKILDKTRELVLETFEKSSSDVKDGMDISLLAINKSEKKVLWSGANNPLWYIQNDELKEIKADKQPIGKSFHASPFNTHIISIDDRTTFYLFTDGFADQFGGPKGKKYKYKQLAELILSNHSLAFKSQESILETSFANWKGSMEQVDDVCIIGLLI